MPFVTLLKPASLRMGKITFIQGVKVPVTMALAEALEINPRFKVDFRGEDEAGAVDVTDTKLPPVKRQEKPGIETGISDVDHEPEADVSNVDPEAVADAIDALDLDDEDAYLDSGLPNPAAVSRILETEVTANDIARAMKLQTRGQKPAATTSEIVEKQAELAGRQDEATRKAGIKIVRKTKHVEEDDTAGAVEA